jgi:hypothetical protein
MTKMDLLATYEAILIAECPWALDEAKLHKFMRSVELTITTEAATWNHTTPLVAKAWRALGGKGKPTLKAMRALSE